MQLDCLCWGRRSEERQCGRKVKPESELGTELFSRFVFTIKGLQVLLENSNTFMYTAGKGGQSAFAILAAIRSISWLVGSGLA